MNLYGDTSALVKLYLNEAGSAETLEVVLAAADVGTSIITLAELGAALRRAAGANRLTLEDAALALAAFQAEWPGYQRIQLPESLIANALAIAWQHQLRGYDAVHLAAAFEWQAVLGEPVVVATFDQDLWDAAAAAGLQGWPPDLSAFR
jgi:uncharacterized protein